MKKHFIVTTVIIDTLILIMFLLGTGFFTYFSAIREMNSMYQKVENAVNFSAVHGTWLDYCDVPGMEFNIEGTGFYGFNKSSDGKVIDTSSDFFVVSIIADEIEDNALVSDRTVNGHDCYRRIFALKDDVSFDTDQLWDVTFTGECDDTFICNGTMTFQGNRYELRDIEYSSSERVPFSSMFENYVETFAVLVDVARNEYEERLNREAKDLYEDICNNMYEGYILTTPDDFNKKDILTSYCMAYYNYPEGAVNGCIYIFHPLETVLRSNIALYIILFIVFVFMEVFVIYMMRKSYRTRQEQELRSRRLRRGIAHELKTPLAIAKLYMENQEYIDETERPEYSRKVNRELEDMTGLIDALLEMDKIDSGKDMLKTEELDINSMIKSVYTHIKPLADERNLDVKLPEDKEYLVKADIKFMRIAVGNYLTNMVKYAEKEAKVTISIHGNAVRVVFENDSTNDKKSGIDKLNSNGMGVEINENIMRLHGFKYGSGMYYNKTRFWFEAAKV